MDVITSAERLECPQCKQVYDIQEVQSFATCCNQPLVTIYQPNTISKIELSKRASNMWRYAELLPVQYAENIVSLNEGWTKIHDLTKIANALNLKSVLLKDESTNPTGSFKARGISAAISKAKELGIQHTVIPTAGNAGGAMAAYCAKANIGATVIMPRHTAETLKEECRLFGAELILLDGLIDSCGKLAKQLSHDRGYYDFSTMKEPYRLEGKKTIGFEIAEQLNWTLPDVIIYPTGGGTGLIGMWKAFAEMKTMGWITGKLPRMVVVQSEACAPMLHYFNQGKLSEDYKPLPSAAYGLAVPYPFAKDMMLTVLNKSGGTVVTVSEQEITDAVQYIAGEEGLLLSPEGASTYMGLKKLVEAEWIAEDETVLLFNTGSWYKYR